jgi:putative chitinase
MSFNFTMAHAEDILKGNKNIAAWHKAMTNLFPKYDITTAQRIAGFLAQCGHESRNFTVLEENLNYSSDALDKIFPKYFKNKGVDAKPYHRQPEKIANVIYQGRMGNDQQGDGWRFRGRGPIQLTGRNNYTAFGRTLNQEAEKVVLYMETIPGALESALWFWKENNINKYCDSNDIVTMTKRINGGTIGLEDRKKHYEHAVAVLTGKEVHVAVAAAPAAPAASGRAVTVKLGSRGETVKKVQAALGLTADGAFGPGTHAALVAWQESQHLTPDGIAGPKTQSLLWG